MEAIWSDRNVTRMENGLYGLNVFIKTHQTVRLRPAQSTVCKLSQLKGTTPTADEPAVSDSEYLTSLGRWSLGLGRSPSPPASSSQGMSTLPEPVCPANSNLSRGLGANIIPTPSGTPRPPSCSRRRLRSVRAAHGRGLLHSQGDHTPDTGIYVY